MELKCPETNIVKNKDHHHQKKTYHSLASRNSEVMAAPGLYFFFYISK